MGEDSTRDRPTVTLRHTGSAAEKQPVGVLAIVHPPELARRVELKRGGMAFGRQSSKPEGELTHDTVSRRHLRIDWDGRSRAHLAVDLGSRNGSWLDGSPLGTARTVLGDGAVLRMGGVVGVYEKAGMIPEDASSLADAIPGGSIPMCRLRRQIALAAEDPSPALVVGPTGAGKEHVARALHERSGRTGPLVAVNMAELSSQLAESQLFGHVRGAFTGANEAQSGLIRSAEGGTLFFDEIGELPLELQPKLLRVIQEREVRPVGGTRTESFDVRMVAATNRELASDVDAGRFRRDLWARLTLWELAVPALTQRRSDIPGWIDRLHRRWCDERGRSDPPLEFDSEAIEAILLADWPDNLRGVDRLVHRLAVTADGEPISKGQVIKLLVVPIDLASKARARHEQAGEKPPPPPKRPAPQTAEELSEVLDRLGSVRATARWYGRHRRQIYRWIEALGVERDEE